MPDDRCQEMWQSGDTPGATRRCDKRGTVKCGTCNMFICEEHVKDHRGEHFLYKTTIEERDGLHCREPDNSAIYCDGHTEELERKKKDAEAE